MGLLQSVGKFILFEISAVEFLSALFVERYRWPKVIISCFTPLLVHENNYTFNGKFLLIDLSTIIVDEFDGNRCFVVTSERLNT